MLQSLLMGGLQSDLKWRLSSQRAVLWQYWTATCPVQ